MITRKNTKDELYTEWRKYIDKLAQSGTVDTPERTKTRTLVLEIGHIYQLKSKKNIALHVYGES